MDKSKLFDEKEQERHSLQTIAGRLLILFSFSFLFTACRTGIVEYYDNGNPIIKGFERNGKDCGTWTNFYPNGNIAAIGKLKNGKKKGLWKYYTKDKKLYQKIFHYPDGYEIVSDFGIMPLPQKLPPNCTWKYYDKRKKLIKIEKYINGKQILLKNY